MNFVETHHLNKNHGITREFCLIDQSSLFCGFDQSSDTSRAQCFSYFPTIFENTNLLQIGFEFSICRSHRKTAIVPECCGLPTFFTLCHNKDPFNYECLIFAGLGTAQQSSIISPPVTFYKNSVN